MLGLNIVSTKTFELEVQNIRFNYHNFVFIFTEEQQIHVHMLEYALQ